MPTVRIPTPLRSLTGGQSRVEVKAATVAELLQRLDENHPGCYERLVDEQGELRRFVSIYVDGEHIRFRNGFDTPLTEHNEVWIVRAFAGG